MAQALLQGGLRAKPASEHRKGRATQRVYLVRDGPVRQEEVDDVDAATQAERTTQERLALEVAIHVKILECLWIPCKGQLHVLGGASCERKQ